MKLNRVDIIGTYLTDGGFFYMEVKRLDDNTTRLILFENARDITDHLQHMKDIIKERKRDGKTRT